MNGDWFSWSGKYNRGNIKDTYGDPNLDDGLKDTGTLIDI